MCIGTQVDSLKFWIDPDLKDVALMGAFIYRTHEWRLYIAICSMSFILYYYCIYLYLKFAPKMLVHILLYKLLSCLGAVARAIEAVILAKPY
jgi:hypothetical protein